MTDSSARHSGVAVVDVSRDELMATIVEALEDARMTPEEFVALGRSDELEDDRLRDLWLMLGPVLESQ